MASEVVVDLGANASTWDTQSAGQHAASVLLGSEGANIRSGTIAAFAAPLEYYPAGGMRGQLNAGRYFMRLANTSLGGYPLVLPASVLLDHETADAQPRTDLVIAELGLGGAAGNFARFRVVKGIASASAPVPTTNWVTRGQAGLDLGIGRWEILAEVPIPANSGAIGSPRNRKRVTVAAGGTVPVPGAWAARPSNPELIPPGGLVLDPDARRLLMVLADGGTAVLRPFGVGVDLGVWNGRATDVAVGLDDVIMFDTTPTLNGNSSENQSASVFSKDFYLPPDGVFTVDVSLYCTNQSGFAGQYRLVRSEDDYTLASMNLGQGTLYTATTSRGGIRGSEFPRLTVKCKNTSPGVRTFDVTVTITRTQTRVP